MGNFFLTFIFFCHLTAQEQAEIAASVLFSHLLISYHLYLHFAM